MTRAQLETIVVEEFNKVVGENSRDIQTAYRLGNKMKKRVSLGLSVKARFFHSKQHTYLIVKFFSDKHDEIISCCLTEYTRKVPKRYLNKM